MTRILLIAFLSFSFLFSQASIVIENQGDVFEDFEVQLYEDTGNSLSFSQIQTRDDFVAATNSISSGYSQSSFWFKFDVENRTSTKINYLIAFSENRADAIDCYIVSSDLTYKKFTAGISTYTSSDTDNSANPRFEIMLAPSEIKTVYIRLYTKYANNTSFKLIDEKSFSDYKSIYDKLYFFYFGSTFALILYNLFLYLFIRDGVYLLYVLYVASFLTWQLQSNGIFPFNSYSSPFSYYTITCITVPLFIAFLLFFSREILNIKLLFPRMDKFIKYMGLFFIFLSISSIFYLQYSYMILNTLVNILVPFLLYVGIRSYQAGNKTALFYIIVQGIFLVCGALFSLMSDGFIEYNLFTRHIMVVGSYIEIILFSIALAYRIKLLQNEKLNIINQANLELEGKIQLRTKELEDNIGEFEILFNEAINTIAVFENNICINVNDAGVKTFGYGSKEEIIGKSVFDFIAPSTIEKVTEKMKIKSVTAYENLSVKRDGTIIPVLQKGFSYEKIGRELRMISLMDMTEIKETEALLKSEKVKAEESTKIKSEFLANMSHEIRTPMNGIIGMSHLALQTTSREKQRHYIEKIDYSAKSLLGIINDILDFSKIEAGKLEIDKLDFNLKELLASVSNIVGLRSQEKGLIFDIEYSDTLPLHLYGDVQRISQVLINLIGNAIKFTDKGYVKIVIENSGDTFIFRVIDTGIGMNEAQQENLFTPFSQADGSTTRKYGGTGLGLSISKQLIELMGGEIWCSSEESRGSTFGFSITLPKALNEIKIVKHKKLNINVLASSTILLVEDNSTNQEIVLGLLEDSGIIIDIANNGAEAIEKFKANKYELILMDIQMPIMDGYEATRIIREYDKEIPIIALTANAMKEDIARTQALGMNEHLNKPIDVEKLYEILLKYLSQKIETKTDIKKENSIEIPNFRNINTEEALKHLADNKKLFLKILDDFYTNYENINLESLEKEEYKRVLHTTKGLSANIGAIALNEITKELEENNTKELQEQFCFELKEVLKEIEPLSKNQEENQEEKEQITESKRDELFLKLREAVQTSRPKRCEPIILEIQKYQLSSDDTVVFEEVTRLIKKYKFKEILSLLKGL